MTVCIDVNPADDIDIFRITAADDILRLAHPLAMFRPFDTPLDRVDSALDGLLNEIRSEVGFLTVFRVEHVPCSCVGRDTLCVREVRPTELGSTVGTVKELLGGFVEILTSLVGDDELDSCGTPDLNISEGYLTVIKWSGVR